MKAEAMVNTVSLFFDCSVVASGQVVDIAGAFCTLSP